MMTRVLKSEECPPLNATSRKSDSCPACGGQLFAEIQLFDDRYGYPGKFTRCSCVACGHSRIDAAMPDDKIQILYTNYYPRSDFDVLSWSPPLEASSWRIWLFGLRASAYRWVPRNIRVLDIGCGFGESLGYHRNRGCDAHGVEADANILRVAERYGLNVKVGLFNDNSYDEASFDYVTLDQVIEHVSDPATLLTDVAKILKPAGRVVLSTPNAQSWGARVFGRRWIHWHVPYHQHFFTIESMRLTAALAGFEVECTKTITNSAWLKFQYCHLVAPTVEGLPSAFWSNKAKRSLVLRLLFIAIGITDRLGINIILTRALDALGVGDNRIFVLIKARHG